jgi:ribose-phosphate pyrophosphokinase
MEFDPRRHLLLYSGTSHPELADEVAKHLGCSLSDVDIEHFADGEIYARFLSSVRGADVFVLQTHSAPVNDHIIETLIMLDALKRASARRVTTVLPYFPYSRQDKKHLAREPISAKLMADLLNAAGADRVMSIDLHAGQIQGFFDVPFDHLTALPLLVEAVRAEVGGGSHVVVVAPDAGEVKDAEKFRRKLGPEAGLAIAHKRREPTVHDQVRTLGIVGDVAGKVCVLVDDSISTGGTLAVAAETLVANGATKVIAAATHAVFSGGATERLQNSAIDRVIVTNSLPIPPEKGFAKLHVVSVGQIIADAIRAVFEDESVSGIFGGDN